MDNDNPAARVERTFWTVWNYITGAVSRFFRPEPIRNDPNSSQESAVDSDPANGGQAEGDASRREVNEEQPVATVSELSSSRPVVEWELCTTEIDLGPDEESMQYKTQLSKGTESTASDEGEGKREEQFVQTGNDDAGLLVGDDDAKEDRQEEDRKSSTHEQDETQENDEHEEHVNTMSLKLTADAVSEDVEESGRKSGAEEETEGTMTPDDLQKIDETITKIKVMEEDEKMHQEDEQDLKAEDVEVKLCTVTTLSLDEEDSEHMEEAPLVEPVVQESGFLFEEEEGKLSADSMKTGIEHSGNESELHVGLTDEKTTEELQDGTEELLVEIDEGLCDFEVADAFGDDRETAGATAAEEVVGFADGTLKFLEPEIQNMTTFFQESLDTVHLQNGDRTSALLEELTETGFLKQSVETEPNLLEDSAAEMQDAGIDMDETCYEVEVEAAEDEVQNKNEMETLNLQVAGMAGEPTTERNEKDNTLIAEAESLETTQLSDEALEISSEETEAADESMTSESKPDMTVISAEEKAKRVAESKGSYAEESPISGRQGVIDEEILDLWIQTALSEDTDGIKRQEGPETGQRIDAGTPSNEEQDESSSMQTEKGKEQLVETNSEQSELVCETEMSSSTAEAGLLDQSLCELSTQNSEIQLLNTAGSFQGTYDMLADMSESADSTHMEEASLQRDEADTAVMQEEIEDSDGLLLLASENKSDEEAKQVENKLLVGEEFSDDERDFKGDSSFTSQDAELEVTYNKSAVGSEDELTVVGQEHVMAHRSESDKVEDVEEKEDENTLDEMEQGAVTEEENANEAANNQTINEVPEREDDIKSDTEEDISTGHVTCEEFMQNAKTELHTVEITDGEEEDVAKDTEVQSKTRETDDVESESRGEVIDGKSDVTATDVSADERFFDKDQVEEKRLSSEVGDKESYMEVACTTPSVTVKPEGETGQEVSGEFKNIPQGICEGRLVVSQELNSPPSEETQEGVPEYNNEPGPDENTTQRFLEEGDREEIQTMQLPEEVESEEQESLQNSGCSSGADYLVEREHMEEGNPECITNRSDLVVEEHSGILRLTNAGLPQETEAPLVEPVVQESGLLFEEEEGKLSADSMKTGIEHSGNEFELHVGLTDEKTTEELQDGTEELLVEIDEGLCDFEVADAFGDDRETAGATAAEEVVGFADGTLKFLEPEIQNMTTFFQESLDTVHLQNSDRTSALLEELTETGFLKQSVETELNLLEDSAAEMQDAGIDMDETCYEVEVEAAEDEVQNKNEMETLNLQVAGMAGEPTTERNEKDNTLIAEAESLETTQLSDEALEISSEETEAADESMTSESKPDMTVISAEEKAKRVAESRGSYAEESPISERQGVIDEEILDLWIQTALSEDTDGIKRQEGPETGQRIDAGTPSNEEQDESSSMQTEKGKEQLVETNSEQSELVCETEMSSSTAEAGLLDQSLCELSTQNSEIQLPNTAGSFQGTYDMLADMSESADVSESTQEPTSESQDLLMEETVETEQSYLKEEESGVYTDSGVTSSEDIHQYQESNKSQEKTDEETGSQKDFDAEVTDITRKTEEADVQSLTEMSPLIKVDETKGEEEPLEAAVSDSPDEIEHTDSGRSRSGSEASLEEEVVLAESGPQGDTCSESEEKLLEMPSLDKPQPRWPEDIIDSLPELNRNEMAEQLTMEAGDQMKVEVLDCTLQRSRIAVKNPLVRPPKDPRSLLHMPSVDPTPASHLPAKIPAGVPLGGLGIGIKLPGFGAGFPVLKKTQRAVRDENSQENLSQEPETKPEEKSDTPKQDETQRKPKWTPPRHPGFGNPLMSELKTKLKKTPKDDEL